MCCSIDDALCFNCSNEQMCYSLVFRLHICDSHRLRDLNEIPFQDICDHNIQVLPVISDGQDHTNETECEN